MLFDTLYYFIIFVFGITLQKEDFINVIIKLGKWSLVLSS